MRLPTDAKAVAMRATTLLLLSAAAQAGPRIACDEPSHNFGVARNVEYVEHVFSIRNQGDADLVIRNVRTSCGCTTTQMSRQTVPPGGAAPLAARFSLVGRQGPQQKYIYVECNDPTNNPYRLLLSGEVRTDVEVKPNKVYFSRIPGDPPAERAVSIVSTLEAPLRILGLETNNLPGADVRVDTAKDGREYLVLIRVGAMSLPPGSRHEGEVIVRTDCPAYARIGIPVSVLMQEELIVVPREIMLREGAEPQPAATRYLLLRPAGDRRLELLGVEAPSRDVTVNTSVIRPNQFRIAVNNLTPAAGLNGTALRIRVRRWDGKEQEITVPIRVEARAPGGTANAPQPAEAAR